jgi:homocysteine S-methyltransferase
MGTMLHARGIGLDRDFDELSVSQPAMVGDIHRQYIEAGAELIIANSFGANRIKLAAHNVDVQRAAEINAAAVALARKVADAAFRPVWIAGDIGPLGARLAPYGRISEAQALEIFGEQAAALVTAGADAVVCETFSDLFEIKAAIAAVRQAAAAAGREVPVIATVTFTRDDRTLLGDTPADVARALKVAGADVIGVNCSGGPAQILRIAGVMRQTAPDLPLSVKPNAGWPEQVEGRIMYPATPAYFGDYARRFAALGVRVIGGCCGTTPAHIAAMRDGLAAGVSDVVSLPAEVRDDDLGVTAEGIPVAPPTALARKLAAGHFTITVEMDPPRGIDTHKLLAGARLLAEAGADAIDVADSPMARMRMSAWAVSHLVQNEIGLEAVLHFPTRGRNLLRVQGDLLAAHALGIRNLFATLGDPTAIGDYPSANDAYDLVPSGLIKLVKQSFNAGLDHAGAKIGAPTTFFCGCALNLNAADSDKEIKTLVKKIEAGADFALTQPVYDIGPARDFLQRYEDLNGPLHLPILVGVLPLYGAKHAAFLNNEVPGIFIPRAMLDRIGAGGDKAPDVGIGLAAELLSELMTLPQIRGAYLMPPFSRFEMAAEIIERVRVAS